MLKQNLTRCLAALVLILCMAAGCPSTLSAQQYTPLAPRAVGGADCGKTTGYAAIIVGAGLSGLSAAKELQRTIPKDKILILERNDRIGGRAYVGDIGGMHIDYGGAWIHGDTENGHYSNPLRKIVANTPGFKLSSPSELDASYFLDGEWMNRNDPTEKASDTLSQASEAYDEALAEAAKAEETAEFVCKDQADIRKGKTTPAAFCLEIEDKLEDQVKVAERLCQAARFPPKKFCAIARDLIAPKTDVARAFIPTDEKFKQVLPLLIENAGPLESAAELEKSSAIDSSAFLSEKDYFVDRGLGAWVEDFGKDVPVCLNSAVKEIDYSKEVVEVTTADGRVYKGSNALVTVSVGVLQTGKIKFIPELPPWKLDAIKNLAMGNMQKVIIPFKHDIFHYKKDDIVHELGPNAWVGYSGDLQPGSKGAMAFVIKPFGKNMAIGFTGGDRAHDLEAGCGGKLEKAHGPAADCDGEAVSAARSALSKMFGENEVRDSIESSQIQVTHWSLDETSLGAYSVALPGHWEAREILRRPIGAGHDGAGPKRLFFAGEAESEAKFNGSYPGAWTTGRQAARQIRAALAKQKPEPIGKVQ